MGVVLDSSLNFKNYICTITALAYKGLGFLIRMCSIFNSLEVLLILYNSQVRSVLEDNSLVWFPKSKVLLNQIEKVQNRFLRYLNLKYYHSYPLLISSSFLRSVFNMDSLQHRRTNAGLVFLHKPLNNLIESPFLLKSINFYCLLLIDQNHFFF